MNQAPDGTCPDCGQSGSPAGWFFCLKSSTTPVRFFRCTNPSCDRATFSQNGPIPGSDSKPATAGTQVTEGTGVTELTRVRLRLRARECELRKEADRLHGLGAPRDARAYADKADLIDEIVRKEFLKAESAATGVDPAASVPAAVTADGPNVAITLTGRTVAEAWSNLTGLVVYACECKSGQGGWPRMVQTPDGKIEIQEQWERVSNSSNTP